MEDSPEIIVASDEYSTTTIAARKNLIVLGGLNPDLSFHKIFCFQECLRSTGATDFFVNADVSLISGGKVTSILPAGIGVQTTQDIIDQSLVNVFPVFSISQVQSATPYVSPVPESILITLSKSFTQSIIAYVGFARAQGSIEMITFNVNSFGVGSAGPITAHRAVLGIISSATPL